MLSETWESGWQITLGPHDFPHIGAVGVMRAVVFEGHNTQAAFLGVKTPKGLSYHYWRLADGSDLIGKRLSRPDPPLTDPHAMEYYRVPPGSWDKVPDSSSSQ